MPSSRTMFLQVSMQRPQRSCLNFFKGPGAICTKLHFVQVIAANEGTALALAAGHYLATGNIVWRLGALHGSAFFRRGTLLQACVYLQNSGLGNTINPLLSLCSKKARRPLERGCTCVKMSAGLRHSSAASHRLAWRARPRAFHESRSSVQSFSAGRS